MRGAERCIHMKVMSSACAFVLAAIAVVWGAGLAEGISRLVCVGCVFGNVSAEAAVSAAGQIGRSCARAFCQRLQRRYHCGLRCFLR